MVKIFTISLTLFPPAKNFNSVKLARCFSYAKLILVLPWKYNIRTNVNSDISIVSTRRVAIIFFELGVVKNSCKNFN